MTFPRLITLGIFSLSLLTTIGAAMGVTTAAPLPLPKAAMFSASSTIPAVVTDRNRTPVRPGVTDKTVLATMPPGLGVQAISPDIARPLKTNAWWSGGELDQWPAPAFPLPFKAIVNDTGLVLSVPAREWHDRAVISADRDPLRVFAPAAPTGASAVAAGDWDVTFRVKQGNNRQFDVTLVQGTPFAFVRPTLPMLSMALPASATADALTCNAQCGSALLIKAPQTTYLAVSPIRDAFTMRGGVVDVRFEQSRALLTIVAVAPGSDPSAYLIPSLRPFTGTRATPTVNAGDIVTTFAYPVQTIMGILPHHYSTLAYDGRGNVSSPFIEGNPAKLIGTYDTIRGPLRVYLGKGFRTVMPRPSILPSLPPVPALRGDQTLLSAMKTDIETNVAPAGDVYSIGKLLLRTAQLAELADTLGQKDLRDRAVAQVRLSLSQSCSAQPGAPLTFAYDGNAGGIVTLPPAFGSEHYNDHHFHYGYLLHAAAVVGRFDPQFIRDYDDCFRLLARDIASFDRTDPSFPYLRHFDAYAGHSWANGLTLFGDGNNQESTSEAVHAWYALALYARTTGDKNLEKNALWMYALEAQAARTYWMNGDKTAGVIPKEFPYPMFSILWSGKADYATFFDGSDEATRGIQFFPVSTALLPLINEEIVSRVAAPTAVAAPSNIWKTGLTLVDSVFHPVAPLAPDAPIDPGLSRSYVTYWQKALRALGKPVASTGTCLGYVFQNGQKYVGALYRLPTDPETCSFKVGLKAVNLVKLTPGWNLRGWGP